MVRGGKEIYVIWVEIGHFCILPGRPRTFHEIQIYGSWLCFGMLVSSVGSGFFVPNTQVIPGVVIHVFDNLVRVSVLLNLVFSSFQG